MKTKAILPLPVFSKGRGDKKRDVLVSVNNWLPMHFIQKNNVKQAYHKVAEEFIKTLPKYKTLVPHYTLYFKGNRKKDIDNFTAPLHKFLMDALVEGGIIEDDNYDYVIGYATKFGGIEDTNYVVVELTGELA
jgi:Holliday junction resolvase RusA-like endonuclease